jgi:uncharacterized protein (DUF2062 family)
MMNKKSTPPQAVRKENRLLAPLVRTYKRFLKIRGQPREIALGFALGLFVGMTPFIGLHTVMAISLAALLKWNKISAAVAVWFTNAATAPFIYSITYVVGARIAGINQVFSWKNVESLSAVYRLILHTPEMIWAMVIGGVILGFPLAVAGYYLAFFCCRPLPRKNKDQTQGIEETSVTQEKTTPAQTDGAVDRQRSALFAKQPTHLPTKNRPEY